MDQNGNLFYSAAGTPTWTRMGTFFIRLLVHQRGPEWEPILFGCWYTNMDQNGKLFYSASGTPTWTRIGNPFYSAAGTPTWTRMGTFFIRLLVHQRGPEWEPFLFSCWYTNMDQNGEPFLFGCWYTNMDQNGEPFLFGCWYTDMDQNGNLFSLCNIISQFQDSQHRKSIPVEELVEACVLLVTHVFGKKNIYFPVGAGIIPLRCIMSASVTEWWW